MKILEERFASMTQAGETTLAAAAAADLYTTYGFPLDLTEVICREARFTVDLDGAETIVHGAAEATGPIDPTASVDRAYRELRQRLEPSTFTGYEHEAGESRVLGVLRVERTGDKAQRTPAETAATGAEVEVVVAETPFYAESGGQVGDIGQITSAEGLQIDVTDTQRPLPGLVVHVGTVRAGALRVGDRVTLTVDHEARSATRRNHSATHLLHWALRKVLGEHAQQKGSRVGPDVLRFDFAHNRALSREEILRIEDLVNTKVLVNAPVVTDVLPQDEARRRGAMAIFEEKYGDVVRVLTMTSDSIELCGGTHARALGDIGSFKIVSEGGVAAGVRRLFAVTGLNALGYVRQIEAELEGARRVVKAPGGDLIDKLSKLVLHERELEKKIGELERRLLEGPATGGGGSGVDAMLAEARAIDGLRVLAKRVADGTNAGALRELADKLRDKLGDRSVVLLGTVVADKAQLVVMVSKGAVASVKAGELVKAIAAMVGGSGGGRPDMAQAGGTEVGQLDAAIAATYGEVERLTGRA
jgi:alanyl-tRNA synthetase